jgi:hypothetical protein
MCGLGGFVMGCVVAIDVVVEVDSWSCWLVRKLNPGTKKIGCRA